MLPPPRPIGAKHGVHIGWAIDTLDWEKNTGTGGKATGTGGTGGDGEEETGGSSGGAYKGSGGGCTYGRGSPAACWVVSLGCAALALSRRRRRS